MKNINMPKKYINPLSNQRNLNHYNDDELSQIGFKSIGENVLISKMCRIYNPSNISIGSNVRIDDFVLLSGKISIGSFVHLAIYSGIIGGKAGVSLGDFCGISIGSQILASSDDFNGGFLIGPCVANDFRNIKEKPVILVRHSHIGAHSLVLPGSYFEIGSILGAMSINMGRKLKSWSYYYGNPAKKIYDLDSQTILKKEKEFLASFCDMGGGNYKKLGFHLTLVFENSLRAYKNRLDSFNPLESPSFSISSKFPLHKFPLALESTKWDFMEIKNEAKQNFLKNKAKPFVARLGEANPRIQYKNFLSFIENEMKRNEIFLPSKKTCSLMESKEATPFIEKLGESTMRFLPPLAGSLRGFKSIASCKGQILFISEIKIFVAKGITPLIVKQAKRSFPQEAMPLIKKISKFPLPFLPPLAGSFGWFKGANPFIKINRGFTTNYFRSPQNFRWVEGLPVARISFTNPQSENVKVA
ncbi:hypothetical protein [Helicobacter sp. 16-1353]|uniref:acyltransferase n=1 Tax=Helicobacter sp. 16-1353 TaxID=2004996 RepID=UPI0015EEA5CF|nr:hypothetical protein [Helicobacter sp. 16-1353]